MAVKRSARVAGRLHEELSAAIRALRDPRVGHVLVSRVEVTDDLQSAKVYIRAEAGDIKSALKGLGAATAKLRRDVAQALALRYAPTLTFYYDEGPDATARIEALLREVKDEEKGE